ncbi:MAG: hypothetical protein QXU32_09770 [Nitrososphaerales archaeon]
MIRKEPLLDKRVGYTSIIILAIFFFPLTFVHEFGHALVCVASGYSYEMELSIIKAQVTCDETPSNLMLYWAAGGLFATLIALSPLIAWQWAKINRGVLIGSFTIATGHAVNAVIETFAHFWYVTNIPLASIVVALSAILAYSISLTIFGKRKAK